MPRRESLVKDRFAEKLDDPTIAKDTTTLADFVVIYCDGHHREAVRRLVETDAALLGIYGRKRPVLCAACEAHLAYAEKRRAYCNQDPKPFCAYCEVHCYKSDEREWQRRMMRYSGPKSWRKGYAIDGIKHVLDGRKYRKLAEAKKAAAEKTAASAADNQEETL
jgi:hypothetical protein